MKYAAKHLAGVVDPIVEVVNVIVGGALQVDYEEFVAAEAPDKTVRPEKIRKRGGYLGQHTVAHAMTVVIVDGLEIVEIHHSEGKRDLGFYKVADKADYIRA